MTLGLAAFNYTCWKHKHDNGTCIYCGHEHTEES